MSFWRRFFFWRSRRLNQMLADWRIVAVENDEGIFLFRLLVVKPDDRRIAEFDRCVEILWQYESDNDAGLPSSEDSERMKSFDAAVADLERDDGDTFHVAIGTGKGLRTWFYYTRDFDRFMSDLNALLQGQPHYPIEIQERLDPEWEQWRFFVDITDRAKERPSFVWNGNDD